MATRLYFPLSESAAVSPAYYSGLTEQSSMVRRRLSQTKGTSAITIGSTISFTTTQVGGDRQYVSDQLSSGIIFTNGVTTVKMQLMTREFANTDNVDSTTTAVRIFSSDGSTELATLVAHTVNIGSTQEFINNATCRNYICIPSGTTLTGSYTTSGGERLVVDLGYSCVTSPGTTPQAAAKWGENATDLPENNTQTSNGAPWIEFSNDITFGVFFIKN